MSRLRRGGARSELNSSIHQVKSTVLGCLVSRKLKLLQNNQFWTHSLMQNLSNRSKLRICWFWARSLNSWNRCLNGFCSNQGFLDQNTKNTNAFEYTFGFQSICELSDCVNKQISEKLCQRGSELCRKSRCLIHFRTATETKSKSHRKWLILAVD